MTDICVLGHRDRGHEREYRMTVVEDATATLWPETQRVTLDIVAAPTAASHTKQGRR